MTADAAAFDPRLTPDASRSGSPPGLQRRASVFDLRNVVHATGRFIDLFEERRRARATSRQSSARPTSGATATPPAAQPVPPRSNLRNQPPNPFHENLRAGQKKGIIPPTLANLLVMMTAADANPAVRAEAATRAAFALNEIEGRAFQANTHLRLEASQTKQLAESTAKVNAANAEVVALLSSVYRDPAAAAANLSKFLLSRPGPGTVAQEIRNEPALLGQLRGGDFFGLFKRAEHREALAAVSKLVVAIEQRGRYRDAYEKDRSALIDHRAEPKRNPTLADALQAHRQITALQAAIPAEIASAYPDGITTNVLLAESQTLSERVSPSDLMDPTIKNVHPAFRNLLSDQMQRIGDLQSLLAGNSPDRAVDTFVAAAHVKDSNIEAAQRLQQGNQFYPAQRAAEWANLADKIMRDAAKAIMGNYNLHADAQQRGVMPYVLAVQQSQVPPSQTAGNTQSDMHPADMDLGGPDMA